MNKIFCKRPKIREIMKVTSPENFHSFFVKQSVIEYFKHLKGSKLGTVLALGANHVEAETLIRFPFDKIILTGITPPDDITKQIMKKDRRVSYSIENIEKLSFKNASFDLVFVKEALHHVPRPILGLYEMLRVSKKAIIFIEPADTLLGRVLEKLKISSLYEKNQVGNKRYRDNYVYRWGHREIVKILNSYYLESGYSVIFSNCWMSNRYNLKYCNLVKIFNLMGWILSFMPLNRGNYLMCTVFSGKDKPL